MFNLFNENCLETIKNKRFDFKKTVIVTDPPFNVGYHYDEYEDNMKENEYFDFLNDVTKKFPTVIIHYPESIYKFALKRNEAPKRVISWVYNSNTKRQHRDIAFFGIEPNFEGFLQPYKNQKDKRIIEMINKGNSGTRMYDWFEENQMKNVFKEKNNISHPCVMPTSVMDRIIKIIPKGFFIYDPFAGSGSTLISCIKNKIDCAGSEISKKYYEEALRRISEETCQTDLFV